MTESMNLGEFKRFCNTIKPERIYICSEDQPLSKYGKPVRVNMSFSSLVIVCHPNIICLQEGNNTICFERIKCIEVDSDSSALGIAVSIICESKESTTDDVVFNLLIR